MTATTRRAGIACTLGFGLSVVVANWVTTEFAFVPVGFGLEATAGTYAAGLALALRDGVQDALGRAAALVTIAAAAGLSYLVADPSIAVASAVAFLLAELVDLTVYTPLRKRGRFGGRWWAVAVLLSGAVGALVDTLVFLTLAFGWAAVGQVWAGQMVGKAWAQLAYLVLGKAGQVVTR